MFYFSECGRSMRRSRQPRWYDNFYDDSANAVGSGRIISGRQSVKGAWPWQVSLELLHPKFGYIGHWCGGVLISSEWILTAAHCIHNDVFNLPIPYLWTAVLGDWDREIEENTELRVPIDNIIIHDLFHNYQHDIAMMRLSRPANISGKSRIRSVCLPPRRPIFDASTKCVATGWGRTTPTGDLVPRLQEAVIPIHSNKLCREKYGNSVTIRSGHLCAGQLDGSTGTCIGDSGGPLQCSFGDGRWQLMGITSFGSGCAQPGFPDIYTRLSHYLPWIRSKMREKS
ncbi:proproteinase E-like [Chrysoperla carnea]|uniref:proproteinase E-like n=1 Tax=Chrysoperla carnea TaxID=189513 RepID=UPI001D07AB43|nr:proproteinase E-like [Chrysoperla carnea]